MRQCDFYVAEQRAQSVIAHALNADSRVVHARSVRMLERTRPSRSVCVSRSWRASGGAAPGCESDG
jgi:hypothetical protein